MGRKIDLKTLVDKSLSNARLSRQGLHKYSLKSQYTIYKRIQDFHSIHKLGGFGFGLIIKWIHSFI